ncbi:metal ABC transporter ATP-binding protein [Oceanirhabdus sp. W0125-5]|uniref:metal ABC transporter ATP-binding protein n=1 Tax=Oceanirhabdus sp. W0125-5 TaxID=2999116 RepID=UPI0022F348DD|nr:metal ABC transporter ATP-binding protein [Oceanirhabdus sp. W0125-5]WBW97359.1 metal ABC transporter ATP-binding protein [Oceanirhabdus sp. W0125-5]
MKLIDVRNVTLKYDNNIALKDISFSINEKEFIGILGPNGAGKSSLVKVILGILKPQNGKVEIQEKTNISYVSQSVSFDKSFPIKVKDVIMMGFLNKRIKFLKRYSKSENDKADRIMTRLGIIELKNRQIGELSGGQLQKVLIARALVNDPQAILLDEPTASLDANAKSEIFELLKELNSNVAIILVSHNLNMVCKYIDKALIIDKEIVYYGEPDDGIGDVFDSYAS